MSSVIFQPLLHDPLGWKASNTTYADHYQWKKQRLTRKDKILSTYGQQYQRQLQRQKENQQQLHRTLLARSVATNGEQTVPRVASVKKSDDRRESAKTHRQPSSKSMPLLSEEPSISVIQQKPRPSSSMREAANGSRASQRSAHSVVVTSEETSAPAPIEERPRSPREERHKKPVDADNDNSRHWLTYPNPRTPQNIIDSKVRLGQIKPPGLLARAKSALSSATEPIPKVNRSVDRTESTVIPSQPPKPKPSDERHFMDFNLPDTPDELRAARHRIEKYRYHASLDNYPPRPKTCPVLTQNTPKPATPPAVTDSGNEPLPNIQNTSTSDTLSSDNEENKTSSDNECPSVVVQFLDMDGLPTEYAEALQTANAAQDEYMKELKQYGEKKSDHFVYRLPAMSTEQKTDSFKAFRQQQQPVSAASNSLRQQDFGAWARQASDQERTTAMKILHDVLNQPVTNDDYSSTQRLSAVPRTKSGTRKLGRVRTQPRFPIDNEQDFVQNDVWNLTRSEGMISSHPMQTSKSTAIQI